MLCAAHVVTVCVLRAIDVIQPARHHAVQAGQFIRRQPRLRNRPETPALTAVSHRPPPRTASPEGIRPEGPGEDRFPLFFGKVLRPVALDLVSLAAIAAVLHPLPRLPDHHAPGGEIFPGAIIAANPAGAFLDHHDDAPGRAPAMDAPLAR